MNTQQQRKTLSIPIEHAGFVDHQVQAIHSADYALCCIPRLHLHQPRSFLHLQWLRRLSYLVHLGPRLDIGLGLDRDRAVSALVVVVIGAGRRAGGRPSLLFTLTSTFGVNREKRRRTSLGNSWASWRISN